MEINGVEMPDMPAWPELLAGVSTFMEENRDMIPSTDQLARIEAKLDRLLEFDRRLVDLLAPMVPKKYAFVLPPLRQALE
jgi:hypothetical protein